MRSRAEALARALATALLAWLLVRSLAAGAGRPEAANARSLGPLLARWSTGVAPSSLHLTMDAAPSAAQRDWLAALAAAGSGVTWTGNGLGPIAAVAEPVADPWGATRVLVAAPAGAALTLTDAYGPLDSLRSLGQGGAFLARSAPREVTVRTGLVAARAVVSDSLVLGRLLLLGRAGWESKFVVAALEERGWQVDARLALSPRGDVMQGRPSPIDTLRYSAVIALDSTAVPLAGQLERYVRAGGGLILGSALSGAPSLAPLEPGAPGHVLPAAVPFDTTDPLGALQLRPIALGPGALALERRGGSVALAAGRVGKGRVLMVGYDDTWRWRMAGGTGAAQAHRDWWAGLVAAVAHAGRVKLPRRPALDEAPLASLVERLGPATPGSAATVARISDAWLFALIGALLLGEWASRRFRGER